MAEVLRIAGISDTHFGKGSSPDHPTISYKAFRHHVREMSRDADLILHCGDFTDKGDEPNLRRTASILSEATKPVFAVLGNHDIQHDPEMAREILEEGGVRIFDGNAAILRIGSDEVGFVGIPGFETRSDGRMPKHIRIPQAEYEEMITRQFSNLQKSLRRLRGPNNIAFAHFYENRFSSDPADPMHSPLTQAAQLIDSRPDLISHLMSGHDHRVMERPETTPSGIRHHNVAVPINIHMQEGKPYTIISVEVQ